MVDGPGHGSAAPRALAPHDGNVQVRAFTVPALLAVRADRAVTDRASACGFLALGHSGILGPMTSQATEAHLCACGCGTPISPGAKWSRGHFHRGEGTWAPVPGPGEAPDLDDLVPDEADPFGPDMFDRGPDVTESGELDHDPAPADLRGEQGTRPTGRPATPVKASVRRDILAKVSIPLETGGQIWRARDEHCGGRFLEQRPPIAEALTDIICQSPDLIDFFTGPAGGFMIYLKLAAALWPVVEAVLAHHVVGRGQRDEPGRQAAPDLSRYAA